MSDSNRAALRYIEETTWNSLPGTPTMTPIRFTEEDLNATVENITSKEIRDDRMVTDLVQVSRQNNGGFQFELSYGTFDELLEGALFGDWTANVLKNSTIEHYYSIEKGFLDIDEYFLYTGMMVGTFNLTLATSAICTGSFGFMGSTATLGQTTNAAVVSAANTNAVINCMANVANLQEGSPLTTMSGIYVQELSFNISNNLRPVHQITSNVLADVGVGKMDVTGTLNAYFSSDRLFDKFLAGTASKISFQLTDGSNTYTILFPNVKFETDSIPTPGQDADIIENINWRALRDATEDCMIKITRSG